MSSTCHSAPTLLQTFARLLTNSKSVAAQATCRMTSTPVRWCIMIAQKRVNVFVSWMELLQWWMIKSHCSIGTLPLKAAPEFKA